jgi:hypothetical protein
VNIDKGYIVVAVVTAFVSWLVFSPDEDPAERGKTEPDNGSELRALPREPEFVPQQERHGIAHAPDLPASHSGAPYPSSYAEPPAHAPSFRPSEPRTDPLERFSFRPLTERERERLEAEHPLPGYYPEATALQGPPRAYFQPSGGTEGYGPSPVWYSYPPPPTTPQRYDNDFSYRSEKLPSARRDLMDDPSRIGRESRQAAPESNVPWSDPTAPQWGSRPNDWTPPAERMYPNLDLDLYSNRKLTFR